MPEPSLAELDALEALYADGMYLRCRDCFACFGEAGGWTGVRALSLAGRLRNQLGDDSGARLLHLRAWKRSPRSALACALRGRVLRELRGPLLAWEWLRQQAVDTDDAERSELLTLRGELLTDLRDLARARDEFAAAAELRQERPWIAVCQARLAERGDDLEVALTAARNALELAPRYPPAIQAVVRLLELSSQDDEALVLLQDAVEHSESALLAAHLAATLERRGDYAAAEAALDTYAQRSPLKSRAACAWLSARRADVAYKRGDFVRAATLMRACETSFHRIVADRLAAAAPDSRRVVLAVPFVRQDHLTCAPASLAAIARFHGLVADHRALADEICWDGTPDHRERAWAEDAGFAVREFRVDARVARALLDRGLPFTLTTNGAGWAHLQVVMGYDDRRGSLLLREPTAPEPHEVLLDELLRHQAVCGPRGMVLVPASRAAEIADIIFPEAPLYDHLYRVRRALARHDRPTAVAAGDALHAAAPGHRLAWWSRRCLAAYDGDVAGVVAAADGLAALHPDDPLARLVLLGDDRLRLTPEARLATYEAAAARPDVDPLILRCLADELTGDARRHSRAARVLRSVLRARPEDATAVLIQSRLTWESGDRASAVDLLRIAACLAPTDEQFTVSYFQGARSVGRTDEALTLLRQRHAAARHRSGAPAITLARALATVDRDREAFEVLDAVLVARPHDGDVLLTASRIHAEAGGFARAAALRAAARGHARDVDVERAEADAAQRQGDLAAADAAWRAVLAREPLALDAVASLAAVARERDGAAAAVAVVRQAVAASPDHFGLNRLLVERLREEGPVVQLPAIREHLARHPRDAWMRRECGWVLLRLGRVAEAELESKEATAIERGPLEAFLRGDVAFARGDRAAARAAWRDGLALSIDAVYGIDRLIASCTDAEDRRRELAYVRGELERQTTFGDGLAAFRRHAVASCTDAEIESVLRAAHAARPDLWRTWSILIEHLVDAGRAAEAAALATSACERFPFQPHLWYDRGNACRASGDAAGEREAWTQTLTLDPTATEAARRLAAVERNAGDSAAARTRLEQAVARKPSDAAARVDLAKLLDDLGDAPAAATHWQAAVRAAPGYVEGWRALVSRGAQEAVALAKEETQRRPGVAAVWVAYARIDGGAPLDERIARLDRAIASEPTSIEAHALRAELLEGARRIDDALSACAPPAFLGNIPPALRLQACAIRARTGRLNEAIAGAEALTAELPDLADAWLRLCEWYGQSKKRERAVVCARTLVRLRPREAFAWGWLGDALLVAGRRDEGIDALMRAHALDRSYRYAPFRLFEFHLAHSDPAAAAAALASMTVDRADAWTDAMTVQLALHRREPTTLTEALQRLATRGPNEQAAVERAMKACNEAVLCQAIVAEALNTVVGAVAAPEAMVRAWAKTWVGRRSTWRVDRRLVALDAGPNAAIAWTAALEILAHRRRTLPGLVRRRAKLIRRHASAWGTAGYALLRCGRMRATVRWMRAWRERGDVRPWMLSNLVIALMALGRDASDVLDAAQAMPADGSITGLRVRRCWHRALAGDAAGAAADQAAVGEPSDDGLRLLARVTRARLAQVAGTATPLAALAEIRTARAKWPGQAKAPSLKRSISRTASTIVASATGGGRVRAWLASIPLRPRARAAILLSPIGALAGIVTWLALTTVTPAATSTYSTSSGSPSDAGNGLTGLIPIVIIIALAIWRRRQ